MIICEQCKHEFDYTQQKEICENVVFCPQCGIIIDKEGKVLENREELEKLCKRCGLCCYGKVKINGIVYIFINHKCPHLEFEEVEGKQQAKCLVYMDRFNEEKIGVKCLPIDIAIKRGVLPKECGYMKIVGKEYTAAQVVNNLRDIRTIESEL